MSKTAENNTVKMVARPGVIKASVKEYNAGKKGEWIFTVDLPNYLDDGRDFMLLVTREQCKAWFPNPYGWNRSGSVEFEKTRHDLGYLPCEWVDMSNPKDMTDKLPPIISYFDDGNPDSYEIISESEIVNIYGFCKFNDTQEIGIATEGYFASTAWIESDEEFNQVAGRKFGWIDNAGEKFCNSKHDFSRPSQREVLTALECYPGLHKAALKEGYIKSKVD